jgi:2-haloacid dehalogenase
MSKLVGIEPARFQALSFDVYGTLLDWEPEIVRFLRDWLEREGQLALEPGILARYDRLRHPIQSERPALLYPEVLRRTLAALGAEIGAPVTREDLETFGGIAARHRPFPDTVPALEALRGKGFKLAALSNIDEHSFATAMASAGLSFDVVVTAERVGAYKPDHAHFRAVLTDLAAMGIPRDRVLHVAQSLRADIVPANALGLTCVWLNRRFHVFGREGQGAEAARPDFEAASLAELAAHLTGA